MAPNYACHTVSEIVLSALKIVLLAFLYIFFLRVLRAVWIEVRSEQSNPSAEPASRAAAPQPEAPAKQPERVAVGVAASEPGDRSQVRYEPERTPVQTLVLLNAQGGDVDSVSLAGGVTMGRRPGCEVVLQDTYASQMHAKVYPRNGVWILEDLGSTNGTYVNQVRVTGTVSVNVGDRVRIGNTEMELR